jgi:hypothetical protein
VFAVIDRHVLFQFVNYFIEPGIHRPEGVKTLRGTMEKSVATAQGVMTHSRGVGME